MFDLSNLNKFLTDDQSIILLCDKNFDLSNTDYKYDKLKFIQSINSNKLKAIDNIELTYKDIPINALTLKANPNKKNIEYFFIVENYEELSDNEIQDRYIDNSNGEINSFKALSIYNCVVTLKDELANLDLENFKIELFNNYLKEIAKFAFSSMRTSNNIETYSNLVNHTINIRPQITDIVEFMKTCVDKINDLAYDMPVQLKTLGIELDTDVYEIMVDIDVELMEIAIIEIVSNSFKFSIDTPKVYIKIESTNDYVYINFYDEGIGFPLNNNDIVFDPFEPFVKYQSPSLTQNFNSLGLGLSIAKHIVNSMLGDITIFNRDEGGCLVTISLPIIDEYINSYNLAEPEFKYESSKFSNYKLNFAEILDLNLF